MRADERDPLTERIIGCAIDYRPDLIIDGDVMIEVKSVAAHDPVFMAQMLTCLRVTGITVGLIVNFNRRVLRDRIRRVIL